MAGIEDGSPSNGWVAISRWAPFPLLLMSVLTGWMFARLGLANQSWTWSFYPTALLLLGRLCLLRVTQETIHPGGLGAVTVIAANLMVTLIGSLFNPFLSIYSFTGYFDAERFLRGRRLTAATIATGIVTAAGQTGGIPGATNAPWAFLIFVMVNVGIAMLMLSLRRDRERQVRAREQAVAELAEAHRTNLALHAQVLEQARAAGVAQERTRLSREIHDTVAQGLIAVVRQLEAIPAGDGHGDAARRHLDQATVAARACLIEARRAVHALAPRQLEGRTLSEALHEVVRIWAERHRIVVELDADRAPESPTPYDEVVVRVTQEALANAARHSGAESVQVVLEGGPDGLRLVVRDDGAGFDAAVSPPGRGLTGMRERIEAVGGSMLVESSPGAGCVVEVRVPL